MEEIRFAKYLLKEIEEIDAYVDKHPYENRAGYSAQTVKDDAKMIRRLMLQIIKKHTHHI